MKIVIPARKDSKGIPFKNRKLFDYTANTIPKSEYKNTIVSTNDSQIISLAKEYGFIIHNRSESNASDNASTKDFMLEVIGDLCLTGDICMLYLTYPQRTWQEIKKAQVFYRKHGARSLLCREEVETHPYVCLYEDGDFKGKQVIDHDLCRRQDYPKCFKVCHKIAIFNQQEIHNLNSNIYNEDTIYFPIKKTLDIDTPFDLERIKK